MDSAYDDKTFLLPDCSIRKSTDIALTYSSPWLIAVSHVLHRLSVPRHSPCALCSLTIMRYLWFFVMFENRLLLIKQLIYPSEIAVFLPSYNFLPLIEVLSLTVDKHTFLFICYLYSVFKVLFKHSVKNVWWA